LSWLAVTRLSLVLYTAGNWPDDDEMPARHLAELVGRLVATTGAEDHRAEAAALAAVIVTAVRQRSDGAPTDPMTAAAERVEAEAIDLFRADEPSLELITEYVRCVRTPAGFAMDPGSVQARLATVLQPGVAHAIELAANRGWACEQRSERVLMVEGRMSHPDRAAANLLSGSPSPLAVVATSTDTGHRGLAIWAAPDLFTIRVTPALRWQHFTGAQVDAIVSSMTSGRPTRFRVTHGALRDPIPAAVDWLHELGLADFVFPIS
jgi:hypothetical protein